MPVWGQTGVSSSKSSGAINFFGNIPNYSGSTTYTPTYGVAGSSTHMGTEVFFAWYIIVSGIDLEKFKETGKIEDAQEIWSSKVNSVGASGDLREIYPILLIASQEHVAGNTGKKISYNIREDEQLFKKINDLKHGSLERFSTFLFYTLV